VYKKLEPLHAPADGGRRQTVRVEIQWKIPFDKTHTVAAMIFLFFIGFSTTWTARVTNQSLQLGGQICQSAG